MHPIREYKRLPANLFTCFDEMNEKRSFVRSSGSGIRAVPAWERAISKLRSHSRLAVHFCHSTHVRSKRPGSLLVIQLEIYNNDDTLNPAMLRASSRSTGAETTTPSTRREKLDSRLSHICTVVSGDKRSTQVSAMPSKIKTANQSSAQSCVGYKLVSNNEIRDEFLRIIVQRGSTAPTPSLLYEIFTDVRLVLMASEAARYRNPSKPISLLATSRDRRVVLISTADAKKTIPGCWMLVAAVGRRKKVTLIEFERGIPRKVPVRISSSSCRLVFVFRASAIPNMPADAMSLLSVHVHGECDKW
jgi:hypothetical protein